MTDSTRLVEALREHERSMPVALGLQNAEEHAWVQTTRDLMHQAASTLADSAYNAQRAESGAGVADDTIRKMAMACARQAYGYWRGEGARTYFDEGLPRDSRQGFADDYERVIREVLAAAPEKDQ